MPLNVQIMSGVSHEMVGTCLECLEHALTCMDMPDISGYQLLRLWSCLVTKGGPVDQQVVFVSL